MGVYAIFNEAQSAPLASRVTVGWLNELCMALNTQLGRDLAPLWGSGPIHQVVVGNGSWLQPGAFTFAIVDSLPNAPGAIAYHDVDGHGLPIAYLALDTCQTLDDVSVAISHEVLETQGDAACNLWADGGDGYEYARELCDAVESATYRIDGIAVSDFVLPAFFDPAASGPYDFSGVIAAPFLTASGGYQIRRNSGTGETDVTGLLPVHKLIACRAGFGRPARRGHKP